MIYHKPEHAELTSNQYHARVLCHAISVTPEGIPFALLQHPSGEIRFQRLDTNYSLRLEEWED